jgi:hypothetical protein
MMVGEEGEVVYVERLSATIGITIARLTVRRTLAINRASCGSATSAAASLGTNLPLSLRPLRPVVQFFINREQKDENLQISLQSGYLHLAVAVGSDILLADYVAAAEHRPAGAAGLGILQVRARPARMGRNPPPARPSRSRPARTSPSGRRKS